jgi:hypothetical protein
MFYVSKFTSDQSPLTKILFLSRRNLHSVGVIVFHPVQYFSQKTTVFSKTKMTTQLSKNRL